jgi:hypothetical protein
MQLPKYKAKGEQCMEEIHPENKGNKIKKKPTSR